MPQRREHHGGDHHRPESASAPMTWCSSARGSGGRRARRRGRGRSQDRTDEADDRAVRATTSRTWRSVAPVDEHPDRAKVALREHGEAADGTVRDEQHAEDECGERDVSGLTHRPCDRGGVCASLPMELSGTPGASNNAVISVGIVHLSRRRRRANCRGGSGVLDDADPCRSYHRRARCSHPQVKHRCDEAVTATSSGDGKCPETSESIGPLEVRWVCAPS